jgi:hypothetical protein
MKLLNRLFFTKHYRSEKISSCVFISKNFQGFGFLFDTQPAQADNQRLFVIEIIFFYFRFWIVKYKK